ncbi:hypothetical protein JW859_05745 [bacterium]|nr:hypothetical protein [bacterium]
MRKLLLGCLLCLLPLYAWAADDEPTAATLCGLCMPACCQLTCVSLELNCCWCTPDAGTIDPIAVEFLAADATVLGTAVLDGPWCDPCCNSGYAVAELDQPVPALAVKYVKISKPGDDDLCLDWFRLCATGDDPCCCPKWYKLFDCCIRIDLGDAEEANDAIILM